MAPPADRPAGQGGPTEHGQDGKPQHHQPAQHGPRDDPGQQPRPADQMTDTANRTDPERTGVWLIGARGSLATTAIAGCAALAAGLASPLGLVTAQGAFADCSLPPLPSLVFGGHDIVDIRLPKRAEALADSGVLPHTLPAAVHAELAAVDTAIRPGGPLPGELRDDTELIAAFAADIQAFTREHRLARTVVINVATSEPRSPGDLGTGDPASTGTRLTPSSLYAAAAIEAGCPYANFTPSTGLHLPHLRQRALRAKIPHAGRDGKTGQTLLRSVLAPMFVQRSLAARAWSGTNLLGGGDGASLADPATAAAKNAGKNRALADCLGELPEGDLHIDNVTALGDWKTAWDHIVFDGFLGTRMVLQTIWQGCDSALAAPLVLDLARLLSRAQQIGRAGPVAGLGFFFKDPDDGSSALSEQYQALLDLAVALTGREAR